VHGTEGYARTFMQIGVHRAMGRRVGGELEGAEADGLPGDADVGLHSGLGRCDHDSSARSFPQTAPIDEFIARQIPGSSTPG